jgi:pimeloyl-ACP methyl ester carboxylesterase
LEDGAQTWPQQLALAERWTLHIPDRVGYGASASLSDGEDFDLDAELLAPALPDGAHLVGHSSGALAAMFTAARRPEAVASLALIEPPAFHLAPEARELEEAAEELFDADLEPVAFLRRFFEIFADVAPARRDSRTARGSSARVARVRAPALAGRSAARRARGGAVPDARVLRWLQPGL